MRSGRWSAWSAASGVTPALGIARAYAAIGSKRRVHIEHSVTSRDKAICDSELESYYPATTFHLRLTGEEGRINAADVLALSHQFADADWLICGSSGFQDGVRALLDEQGILPQPDSHRVVRRGKTAAG